MLRLLTGNLTHLQASRNTRERLQLEPHLLLIFSLQEEGDAENTAPSFKSCQALSADRDE